MLDIFNIPTNRANVQYFNANNATAAANTWVTWNKPRNSNMVAIICIGSGAGGGGGALQTSVTNKGGGGGGGSGGISRLIIRSKYLPDVLYIQVPVGGAGGVGAANGTAGGIAYISTSQNTAATSTILRSSNGTASLGGVGNSSNGGPGGGGATVFTITQSIFSGLGIFTAIVGVNGSTGGFGTDGLSQAVLGSQFITGGAGGGGWTTADAQEHLGGSITGLTDVFPTVSGGGTNINGQDGITLWRPTLITCGGAGGGTAATSGTSGAGGRGGIGSGGGGSGCALTPGGTVANGGKGGDGLVIIATY